MRKFFSYTSKILNAFYQLNRGGIRHTCIKYLKHLKIKQELTQIDGEKKLDFAILLLLLNNLKKHTKKENIFLGGK